MQKNRPEDQHFVSAAYLRAFLPDGEHALFVRRRHGKSWFRQKPENIATRKNFYSVLRKDGTWDDRLEHFLDELIERPGFKALKTLKTECHTLSFLARERIAILLAMQYLRIPQMREDIHRVMQKYLEGVARHHLTDVEGTASDLQRLKGLDESESRRIADELKETYLAGGIELKVRKEASLRPIFELLVDGAKVFDQYDWSVFLSQVPVFFTSDRPVYVSPSSVKGRAHVALAYPDVVLHCPLSSRRFLVMRDFGKRNREIHALRDFLPKNVAEAQFRIPPSIEYIETDQALTDKLNSETIRSCEEWVCGPHSSVFVDRELQKDPLRMSLDIRTHSSGIAISQKIVKGGALHS